MNRTTLQSDTEQALSGKREGAASPDSAPQAPPALVQADGIAKVFDVSAPWLNRMLEQKPRQLLHAVDDVSFSIQCGETLGLVGESGCGKSTVARLLMGLYATDHGKITFDGQDLSTMSSAQGKQLRRRLQMIFQDPYASLNPRWRVADIIAEPIYVHRLLDRQQQVSERVTQLLEQVGLGGADAAKYPHQFSGGQRQRISIARALASEPEFLVCDEPTSALDVSVQAQVLNLMRDLQRQKGLTYLFISHNLAVVHHVSDRVGVMYLGKIVELSSKHALFANPRHPYTRMLLDAIPDISMTGKSRTPVAGEVPNPLNPPTGCSFHPRCPHANDRCLRERPILVSPSGRAAQGDSAAGDSAAGGSAAGSGAATVVACHAVQEGRI